MKKLTVSIAAIFALNFAAAVRAQDAPTQQQFDAAVDQEVQRRLPAAVDAEIQRRIDGDPDPAQVRQLVIENAINAQATLQAAVLLYADQHRKHFPTFDQIADWKILLVTTDRVGRLDDSGEFGPYLRGPSVNALNGRALLAPAGAATPSIGWTYDQTTGVVRLVVPREFLDTTQKLSIANDKFETYTATTQQAWLALRVKTVTALVKLQALRNILEVYKTEHRDKFPTLHQIADWSALTGKSDSRGPNTLGNQGPYLRTAPANPFNGKSAVTKIGRPEDGAGWAYDEKTGILRVIIPATIAAELAPELPTADCEILKPAT